MPNCANQPDRSNGVAEGVKDIVVSVIVPHYNDLQGLERCLAALGRQTYSSDRFEIIVVDNDSPQGADAVAEVIAGRARLVVATERGPGPARNAGVATARGKYLAFTDSDCVPEPKWLSEGMAALDVYDFVGGRMHVLVTDPRTMSPIEAFELVFAFPNETYVKRDGFTVTANLLCSRATFETVGGFRGLRIAEDSNWCYRAREAGFVIGYASEAVVGHPARTTWDELLRKWRRSNLDVFGSTMERKYGRLRWLGWTLLLPASAVAHTPRVMFSNRLRGVGQRVRALGILYRLRLWRFTDAFRLLLAGA
jgi:glycosyltransferase involved in cell wall biosynthesis